MSSSEDNSGDPVATQTSKKRRVQRACDTCRRKKGDGESRPGQKCTNCETHNRDCTYDMTTRKRGPPKGYVENLEHCLQKMGTLLSQLCPDKDLSEELGQIENLTGTKISSRREKVPSTSIMPSSILSSDADGLLPSDDETKTENRLVNSLKHMQLDPSHVRYLGKSSTSGLIQQVFHVRDEYTKTDPTRPRFANRRPEFWGAHPWATPWLQDPAPHHDFPPNDLLRDLIRLYFKHVNNYYPLLHQQTFEKQIAEGVHMWDEGFGSLVLLVCAVGSKWSDDPRVFLGGSDSTHSCGWHYFRQVQLVRKSLISPPRLYDLQINVLTIFYLSSTSTPQSSWTVIGVGLRMAQDVGAHRRKVYGAVYTVEDELWKRAFWILLCLDRGMSMALGRSCAMHEEDYDLDLPVECDDEYWIIKDDKVTFRQPPGKPSKITFFTFMIRLHQILDFALRTLYCINKSKVLLGFTGPDWEQNIVAELDSTLNKWVDDVPDHLRWDPHREDELFLTQSAFLYSFYYHVQIVVHRPFIPTSNKPSPLSYPSLAICTNAARSSIHVINVPYRRFKKVLPFNYSSLFLSAVVILLNIWGGKRSGLTIDLEREMADVHAVMDMLKSLENRWHTAGRLWDVIYDLAFTGNLPLPSDSRARVNRKRDRDSDTPETDNTLSTENQTPSSVPGHPSPAVASPSTEPVTPLHELQEEAESSVEQHLDRLSTAPPLQGEAGAEYSHSPACQHFPSSSTISSSTPDADMSFLDLPLHSDELGKRPIHPGFNNSDPLVASGWYTGNPTDSFVFSDLTTPTNFASSSNIFDMAYNAAPTGSGTVTWDQMMSNFTSPSVSSSTSTAHVGFGSLSPGELLRLTSGEQSMPSGSSSSQSTAPSTFTQAQYSSSWNPPSEHQA
ncbi:hypothetical protein K474DRAFT_1588813 [Panus rudis PR-1116 ss-1]|nr:hypothetical protein K474DRAFT_1588813 [Panus rudis PR-1116 ss-1]